MNTVFFLLIAGAFAVSSFFEITKGGAMEALGAAALKGAGDSVPLAFSLVGVMALFLGLMKVIESAGALKNTARLLSPILSCLFPEVPRNHPALGAMVMNVSANLLGLGNAATPFGIRAMEQLNTLNPHKGTASNAQVLFLAINTASITLIPTSVIALRASAGSHNPTAVVVPTLAATIVATIVAIISARSLQRFFPLPETTEKLEHIVHSTEEVEDLPPYPMWVGAVVFAVMVAIVSILVIYGDKAGHWLIPSLIVGLLGYGMAKGVHIYEVFVEGAKEGFQIAVKIIPYLVAILVAVAMFRTSGAMEIIMGPLGALLAPVGLSSEALTMAGLRSLSGSGAFGLLSSYLQDPSIGVDSFKGVLLSTVYGSSETTFYVLAVYFGAVNVRRIRHALAAGLLADLAGLLAAVFFCSLLVG
jgi:spore maturation protein SpmA/spore maturation protein SpmB